MLPELWQLRFVLALRLGRPVAELDSGGLALLAAAAQVLDLDSVARLLGRSG